MTVLPILLAAGLSFGQSQSPALGLLPTGTAQAMGFTTGERGHLHFAGSFFSSTQLSQSCGFVPSVPDPCFWRQTGEGVIWIGPRPITSREFEFRFAIPQTVHLRALTEATAWNPYSVFSMSVPMVIGPGQVSGIGGWGVPNAPPQKAEPPPPETGRTLLKLADDFLHDGEFEKAEWAYRLAAEKGEWTAQFGRVHSLVALGRFPEAGVAVRAALRAHPEWLDRKLDLRNLTNLAKQFEEQVQALETEAARSDSKDIKLLHGYCLCFTGSRSKAKLFLQRVHNDTEADLILKKLASVMVFPSWKW